MRSSHRKQPLQQVPRPCAALVVGHPGSPAGTVGGTPAEVGIRAVEDTPAVQDSLGVDSPEQCSQGEAAGNTQQVHPPAVDMVPAEGNTRPGEDTGCTLAPCHHPVLGNREEAVPWRSCADGTATLL